MCILDSIFSAPDEARNLKINDKISLFLSLRNIFWDGLRNGKIRSISCRERGQSQRRYKTSRADNEISQNFHNILPAYALSHLRVYKDTTLIKHFQQGGAISDSLNPNIVKVLQNIVCSSKNLPCTLSRGTVASSLQLQTLNYFAMAI